MPKGPQGQKRPATQQELFKAAPNNRRQQTRKAQAARDRGDGTRATVFFSDSVARLTKLSRLPAAVRCACRQRYHASFHEADKQRAAAEMAKNTITCQTLLMAEYYL